jgi:hypothetical protein
MGVRLCGGWLEWFQLLAAASSSSNQPTDRPTTTKRRLYKSRQQGAVGISLGADWHEPAPAAGQREARRNAAAAARALEFTVGWFARPLFEVGRVFLLLGGGLMDRQGVGMYLAPLNPARPGQRSTTQPARSTTQPPPRVTTPQSCATG